MAYTQKNNPFKNSSCKSCGQSPLHQPAVKWDPKTLENIDWDNLTDKQKRAMNLQPEVNIDRYGVDVTRYKNIFENRSTTMPPGHIQASIANPQSEKVRKDLDIKQGDPTQVNPWYDANRRIYQSTKLEGGERYKETSNYETQRIYLRKDQAKEFLNVAKTIKPTGDPRTFTVFGKKFTIPLSSKGYDFMRNNCAKGVCKSLGINPSEAKVGVRSISKSIGKTVVKSEVGEVVLDVLINQVMTDAGITEPRKAWNIVMKKFGIE